EGAVRVAFGDTHDEAQIGLYELLLSVLRLVLTRSNDTQGPRQALVLHSNLAFRLRHPFASGANFINELSGFLDTQAQAPAGIRGGARIVGTQLPTHLQNFRYGAAATAFAAGDKIPLLLDEARGHLEFFDDDPDVTAANFQLLEGFLNAPLELCQTPFSLLCRPWMVAALTARLLSGALFVNNTTQAFQLLENSPIRLRLGLLFPRFAVLFFCLLVEQVSFRDLARLDAVGQLQQIG